MLLQKQVKKGLHHAEKPGGHGKEKGMAMKVRKEMGAEGGEGDGIESPMF